MNQQTYWNKNLRYLSILLSIWFIVGVLCSFVFAADLNQYRIAGFPLGFWFSMQGALIIFVILVFVYAWLMNRLDEEYEAEN